MNDNVEPLPMQSLLQWINNIFDVQGCLIVLYDHDETVHLSIGNLTGDETQNALATAIHLNRLYEYEEEMEID